MMCVLIGMSPGSHMVRVRPATRSVVACYSLKAGSDYRKRWENKIQLLRTYTGSAAIAVSKLWIYLAMQASTSISHWIYCVFLVQAVRDVSWSMPGDELRTFVERNQGKELDGMKYVNVILCHVTKTANQLCSMRPLTTNKCTQIVLLLEYSCRRKPYL